MTTAAHTDKHEEQTLHTGGSVIAGNQHGECDKYVAPVGDGRRPGRWGEWVRGGKKPHVGMAKASHPHTSHHKLWGPPFPR